MSIYKRDQNIFTPYIRNPKTLLFRYVLCKDLMLSKLYIVGKYILGGSLGKGHSYHLGVMCYPCNFYNPRGFTQVGYKSCLGNIFHPGDSYDPRLGNPLL